MTGRKSSPISRDMRALFGGGIIGPLNDRELVRRFASRSNGDLDAEAAFSALLIRHAPLVWGVCRRVLNDPNDAADAFQATFLILVRKAPSIHVHDSLGRWLYGVSRRVAARTKFLAERRASRERSGLETVEPSGVEPDLEQAELLEALDEEIEKLPERFRIVILLCDLGGLSHETAASQLGCPVGTIESRLWRGRQRLRERLIRRGLNPCASGMWVTKFFSEAAGAPLPANLFSRTVEAVFYTATNRATTHRVAMTVAAEVSRGLIMSKLRLITASAITAVSLVVLATAWMPHFGVGAPPSTTKNARLEDRPIKPRPKTPAEVLEEARTRLEANLKAPRSIRWEGEVAVTRKLVQAATDPTKSDEMSRRLPFDIKASFTYLADNEGRHKRWEKHYILKGFSVDEVRALDGDVVYDAADPQRGYIRTAREFLPDRADNIDFYRDHWFNQDFEPIDKIITFLKEHPERFTTRSTEEGLIQITSAPQKEPSSTIRIEFNPSRGGMIELAETSGGTQITRWSWTQDRTTQVWYPERLSRFFQAKHPDGAVWSEDIRIQVLKATFNEPIPPKSFTFEGLGLSPDAKVFDMRSLVPGKRE